MAQLPYQDGIAMQATNTVALLGEAVNFENMHSQLVKRGPKGHRSKQAWAISYVQVSEAEMLNIVAFLNTVGNWDVFQATMPDNRKIEYTYRVVDAYRHTSLHADNHTISFNIVQEIA